jgi:hypothetical protein
MLFQIKDINKKIKVMEDKLIAFDTAKLAKEKGFNEPVISHYRGNDIINNGLSYNFNNPKEQALWNVELTSAPTQSLLQRWLRKVHEIHINDDRWYEDDVTYKYVFFIYKKHDNVANHYFDSFDYEEGLEIALQEALKLIK